MELQGMVKTIIGVMVAVIVVMAMAVPVIGSLTTHEAEKIDDALYRAEKIDTSTGTHTITLVYGYDSDFTVTATIDGVEHTFHGGGGYKLMLLGYPTSIYFTGNKYMPVDYTGVRAPGTDSGGTVTYTITDGIINSLWPSEWLIVPSETGSLAAVDGDAKVKAGQTCYWSSKTMEGNKGPNQGSGMAFGDPYAETSAYCMTDRNVANPATVQGIQITDSTVGSMTIAPPVEGIDPFEIPLAFVPYEIPADAKSSAETLIDLIPLLMIVGLMIAVVAAYYGYSREN